MRLGFVRVLPVVFLICFGIASHATVKVVPLEELKVNSRHFEANQLVTHILSNYHYRPLDLDDSLSTIIFENYLEKLDPNKSYFTQKDIQALNKYRYHLDEALSRSDMLPAIEIFTVYRSQVENRIERTLSLLENMKFEFDVDEYYQFDREDVPWALDDQVLDEFWRKRVKHDMLALALTGKDQQSIKTTLAKRYERLRDNVLQINVDDLFQLFLNAYAESVEPHTAYFSPRISENFDISMRLSLEGIGAVLGIRNEYTQVINIIQGGPASLSNELYADDRIVSLAEGEDGVPIDIIGWRLDDVVDMIRGPKGTVIRLEILPKDMNLGGATKWITLVRDKVRLEEQDASSEIIELADRGLRVGVITLPTFYVDFEARSRGDENYKSTARDVRMLIRSMMDEGIDGIVIDLRGNGGGSLSEALELTGLFIDEGPIVQTRDKSGGIQVHRDPLPGLVYPGPLAVLIDRASASASEIFAGAIQDYNRGIIIGQNSFGKGTVQNVIDLNRYVANHDDDTDYGKLKMTIAQFYRVSGSSTQYKGVEPDIVFPSVKGMDQGGESTYKNALPWNQVDPVKYTKVSAPLDELASVRKLHQQRIKDNELLSLMLARLESQNNLGQQEFVSLMEVKRQEEYERRQLEIQKIKDAMSNLSDLEGISPEEDGAMQSEQNDEQPVEEAWVDVVLNEVVAILGDLIAPVLPSELHTVQSGMSR